MNGYSKTKMSRHLQPFLRNKSVWMWLVQWTDDHVSSLPWPWWTLGGHGSGSSRCSRWGRPRSDRWPSWCSPSAWSPHRHWRKRKVVLHCNFANKQRLLSHDLISSNKNCIKQCLVLNTPVHHGLVRVLPLLLVAVAADLRVQLLQVDSCHISATPHWHWGSKVRSKVTFRCVSSWPIVFFCVHVTCPSHVTNIILSFYLKISFNVPLVLQLITIRIQNSDADTIIDYRYNTGVKYYTLPRNRSFYCSKTCSRKTCWWMLLK